MFLAAVLGKLGAFGILRIVLPLTPEPAVTHGLTVFGTLGAIGIVYAALCAFAQKDLKLLAAYSSLSHLGFLVLGLFALTPESLTGATLHMVNHGLTAGATFALLAFLADRYRTLDANHYGGLWARFPKYTFFFIVIALASIGLPGLNNFVSEMLMLAGLFDPRNLTLAGMSLAIAAAAGIFLSAWYLFTVIRRVFFGPLKEPMTDVAAKDITGRECATFGLLAALCLALGLFPQPLINTISDDVNRIVVTTDAARIRLNVNQRSPADSRHDEMLQQLRDVGIKQGDRFR
jgi:NADH-quinone oxidoreductase subunit M